jgi:hypothetical protein
MSDDRRLFEGLVRADVWPNIVVVVVVVTVAVGKVSRRR